MTTYSEFVLSCRLYDGIPQNVVNILNYLVRKPDEELELPTHPDHIFFQTDRWEYILVGNGDTFKPKALSSFYYDSGVEAFFLRSNSTFNNYDEKIEKFLHWLAPYCDAYKEEPTLAGYILTELETDYLSLIYLHKGKAYLAEIYSPKLKLITTSWWLDTSHLLGDN